MKREPHMSCKYLLLFLLGFVAAVLAVNEKDLKVIRFPFTLAKGEAGREGIESASPFHEAKTVFKNDETYTTSTYYYPTAQQLSEYYSKKGSKTNRDLKNWVPEYKGSVIPVKKNNGNTYSGSLTWNGRCFRNNTATIELDVTRQIASLVIESHNASTYLCADWYFIVTRESYHVKGVFLRGKHHITITKFKEGEIQDILDNGFRVFLFVDGFVGTLIDVYHSYKVLYGTLYIEDKIKFFKENMNISFVERPYRKHYMDPKEIRSGDIFIKDTISGADSLIMYGTGGRAGHMFAGLWFGDELYIVESTDVGVQKTKYADWWAIQDPETMIVIHAHLKPEYQKNFDEAKAIEFFKSVEGMPYGYSNFAYGWIDTLQDNYPAPLDQHMVPATMVLGEALSPKTIYIGFTEGLNQRLRYYFNETEADCQSLSCVFAYLDKHNASLAEVMTLVEKDEWTYPQGKQMVCSAFLMALYKHANIFGDLAETIEATEFTPKDVYQLNLWEVPKEIPEDAKVPGYDYLQIVGKWYWELPGYNTVSMYKHMNEKCGAIPPEYKRFPDDC